MKSLLLIRHGESEHHVNGLTGGWTDTPLTERGRRQVALLAERLREELAGASARLFSSDLLRAAQSAQMIGEELQLQVEYIPELREFNNGSAAGKSREEAELLAIAPSEPLLDWRPYPGAENWREFYDRVVGAMEGLTREQDRLYIVVTHGGTLGNIIIWWLQMGIECTSRVSFEADPASLTVLRLNTWKERAIGRLNDTAHLHGAGMGEKIHL